VKTPRLAELGDRKDELLAAVRRHADPRVRHRAHLLLRVIDQGSLVQVCVTCGCGNHNLGKWKQRFLDAGIEGLVDTPRAGRQRYLSAADDAWLVEIVTTRSPMDFGYIVAIWGLPLLCDLLAAEREVVIKTEALSRNLKRLGFTYTRSRLDLKHLQHQDAVESCRITLTQLQKKGSPLTPASSMLMRRMSTPIQDWQRPGTS